MEKRAIIAIVLTIAVLIIYQHLTAPPPKQPVKEKKVEKAITEGRKDIQPEKSPAPKEKKPVLIVAPGEKEIYVESKLYKAILTNKGAVIKSWELKKYTDNDKKPVQLLKVHPEAKPKDAQTKPEETKAISIFPLSILLSGSESSEEGAAIRERILKNNYSVDKEKISLGANKEKETITFFYQDPSGVSVKKTLTFYNNDYKVDLKIETEGIQGNYIISLGQDFGIFDPKGGYGHVGPVSRINGKNITDKPEKENEPIKHAGKIVWTALEDKYFTAAITPSSKVDEAVINKIGNSVHAGLIPGNGAFQGMLYAGPKEYDRLKALNVGLEDIIDYGWFPFGRTGNKYMAIPFFKLLQIFYGFLHNYGLAIILLTIIIRVIFIPLTNKGQRSMKAMQVLAPRISEIKEKYKKDPQRMNKEVMELYRKNKVNPVGGCLPMLIQLPIFIALYNVLMYAIEMRGAPFYFWITDLSSKDPYYVLPIIMGISMVVQQKMTPTTVDPMQQKIMMLMPIVFTIMFLSFPSGLVIYWLVNNLLGIAQQYYINKKTA